jgi:hypothetical protein
MLVETTAIVRERLRQGKTVEQAKAEGLPEKWKEWGTGFINAERWIETIYTSLKQGEGKAAAGVGPWDWRAGGLLPRLQELPGRGRA